MSDVAIVEVAKVPTSRVLINDEFHLERRSLSAFKLSLFYLVIPAFLFLFSFSKPALGYPIAALLAVAIWLSVRGDKSTDDKSLYLLALIPALGIALLAGFPSGPFAWDWIKHWALINSLADSEWPVVIPLRDAMAHLRFYIAAYLAPAALHKAAPAIPVWIAAGVWFVVGYALVFRLVAIPLAGRGRTACFLGMFGLLLFAGADFFIENWYRFIRGHGINDWFGIHYEMWFGVGPTEEMQYSSILSALLWVPHQSIATFLVAGMVILSQGPRSMQQSILAFGLLALWSPYGMIGLLPLIVVQFVRQHRDWFLPQTLIAAIAAAAFAILTAAYLSTDLPKGSLCLICGLTRLELTLDFVTFWIVELIVFALILRARMLTDVTCLISTLTLLLVPYFKGDTADFVMRASMGPLFVLALRSVEMLAAWRLQSIRARALWVSALTLCVPTAASEVVYHLENGRAHARMHVDDPLNASWYRTFADSPQISTSQFFDICGWRYFSQYFTLQTPIGIRDGTEP